MNPHDEKSKFYGNFWNEMNDAIAACLGASDDVSTGAPATFPAWAGDYDAFAALLHGPAPGASPTTDAWVGDKDAFFDSLPKSSAGAWHGDVDGYMAANAGGTGVMPVDAWVGDKAAFDAVVISLVTDPALLSQFQGAIASGVTAPASDVFDGMSVETVQQVFSWHFLYGTWTPDTGPIDGWLGSRADFIAALPDSHLVTNAWLASDSALASDLAVLDPALGAAVMASFHSTFVAVTVYGNGITSAACNVFWDSWFTAISPPDDFPIPARLGSLAALMASLPKTLPLTDPQPPITRADVAAAAASLLPWQKVSVAPITEPIVKTAFESSFSATSFPTNANTKDAVLAAFAATFEAIEAISQCGDADTSSLDAALAVLKSEWSKVKKWKYHGN